MSNQLKRMTFSIFMDMGTLGSDRYAAGVLQSWQQRAAKIQESPEEFDFSQSRFHKDIYLSGMFLYMLAPNLCKAIAGALGPEQINLGTLRQVFARSGFNLGDGSAASLASDGMVDEIVTRLKPLLGQNDTVALVNEIVSRLGAGAGQQPSQDSLVEEIVARLVQQQPQQSSQDGLVEEIVARLAQQQSQQPSQDSLVEEIVARLGQQQAQQQSQQSSQDGLVDEIVARLAQQQPQQSSQDSLVEEIVARLAQQQPQQPSQDGLVDEIVARLAQQQPQQSSQDGLVDEIVSRIGEQQPTELDHEQLAEAIVGKLPAGGAETDLGPVQNSIQLLSRQLEEQSKLIRDQHRLIQRLLSSPISSAGSAGAEDIEPLIEDLSNQVANMKKIKAKGIF